METTDQKKVTLPPIPKPKAGLFNLIIYTHDPRRAAYFQDVIRMVTSQFPCRIIFIWGDETTKEKLNIKVETEQQSEKQDISFDQITIDVGNDFLDRVPFLILPYLIADLPIYLLWGQDPTTESDILPKLQIFATRLIFDSESTDNLQRFSQAMLDRAKQNHIEITDMNWARIRGWKEVLIETFDTQARIDHLLHSKSIKIVYNSRSSDLSLHPDTQAFYLQAWLATQMKWKFNIITREGAITKFEYQKNGDKIEITLQGEPKSKLASEEILECEISDPNNFLYSLVRTSEDQVTVHCNTMDRCELPFTLFLPSIWSGRSFMQEIFYKKTSHQYFKMLELMSRIPHG